MQACSQCRWPCKLSSCCDCGLRHQQLSRQCALRAAVLDCVVHIQPGTLVPWHAWTSAGMMLVCKHCRRRKADRLGWSYALVSCVPSAVLHSCRACVVHCAGICLFCPALACTHASCCAQLLLPGCRRHNTLVCSDPLPVRCPWLPSSPPCHVTLVNSRDCVDGSVACCV